MSSTLNKLVARVDSTEKEMKTLKRALHSSPSSSSGSDTTPGREKVPVNIRVNLSCWKFLVEGLCGQFRGPTPRKILFKSIGNV